jgi:G:T-mismatch repair DNA endonuclease (very short patch repair protein)
MRDRLTKQRRSWNMSRIRGKNTSPELIVRKLLHRMGYRFRLHVRIPIGNRPRSPSFVLVLEIFRARSSIFHPPSWSPSPPRSGT